MVFTIEKCTPDSDKMKLIVKENFTDDTMRKFLEDVYYMVILPLDMYIVNLNKDLHALENV